MENDNVIVASFTAQGLANVSEYIVDHGEAKTRQWIIACGFGEAFARAIVKKAMRKMNYGRRK